MININDKLLSETTPDQFWLLCHLAKYMGKDMTCFPSNKTLCETTGWKKTKVKSVKQECIAAGLLSAETRYTEDGQATSLYHFKTEHISVFVNHKGKGGEQHTPPVADATPPGRISDRPPVADATTEVLTTEVLREITSPFAFDEFWQAYGFKRGSRKDAEKKWNRLTPAERAEIQRTLPAYLHATTTNDAARANGGRFVPMRKYPLTYLNSREWESYTDAMPGGSTAAPAETLPTELREPYRNYIDWAQRHFPNTLAKGIHLAPSQYLAFKTTIYVVGVRAMGKAVEMSRFEQAHAAMNVDGPQSREYRDVFDYHCKLVSDHAKARVV